MHNKLLRTLAFIMMFTMYMAAPGNVVAGLEDDYQNAKNSVCRHPHATNGDWDQDCDAAVTRKEVYNKANRFLAKARQGNFEEADFGCEGCSNCYTAWIASVVEARNAMGLDRESARSFVVQKTTEMLQEMKQDLNEDDSDPEDA